MWVPATLGIWLAAALIGHYWTWGLPSINSVVIAFVVYVVLGKAGLIRGVGLHHTKGSEVDVSDLERLAHRPHTVAAG